MSRFGGVIFGGKDAETENPKMVSGATFALRLGICLLFLLNCGGRKDAKLHALSSSWDIGATLNDMVLAQDEIDACREAFLAFDKDRYVHTTADRLLAIPHCAYLILCSTGAERLMCGSCAKYWKVCQRRCASRLQSSMKE